MCAKLCTMAVSNNRVHMPMITLLLLVCATYAYCSSRTSRLWWITHSTQATGEAPTASPPFYNEPHRLHVLFVKASHGRTSTSWSQNHFIAIGKARATCAQSFALWQRATIEFTCHDHSIIACSRHVYILLFFAPIPFVVNHTFNAMPPERLQQS